MLFASLLSVPYAKTPCISNPIHCNYTSPQPRTMHLWEHSEQEMDFPQLRCQGNSQQVGNVSSHLLRYTVEKLKILSALHQDPANKAFAIFYPDAIKTLKPFKDIVCCYTNSQNILVGAPFYWSKILLTTMLLSLGETSVSCWDDPLQFKSMEAWKLLKLHLQTTGKAKILETPPAQSLQWI